MDLIILMPFYKPLVYILQRFSSNPVTDPKIADYSSQNDFAAHQNPGITMTFKA